MIVLSCMVLKLYRLFWYFLLFLPFLCYWCIWLHFSKMSVFFVVFSLAQAQEALSDCQALSITNRKHWSNEQPPKSEKIETVRNYAEPVIFLCFIFTLSLIVCKPFETWLAFKKAQLYLNMIKCKQTDGERLGRILVSDLPGQQDGVLHGSLYSEVGGKN